MANLVTINHGASGWDEAENTNFKNLNDSLGTPKSDTGWLSDGITLVNGTQDAEQLHNANRKIGYRIMDFGTTRLISIRGAIVGSNVATASITKPVEIIDFPSATKSPNSMYSIFGFDSQGYSLQVSFFNNGLTLFITGAPSGMTTIPSDSYLYFGFTTLI